MHKMNQGAHHWLPYVNLFKPVFVVELTSQKICVLAKIPHRVSHGANTSIIDWGFCDSRGR
jgi:hypothetical protein